MWVPLRAGGQLAPCWLLATWGCTEKGPDQTPDRQPLDLGFPAPTTLRNHLRFKPPSPWHFWYSRPDSCALIDKLRQRVTDYALKREKTFNIVLFPLLFCYLQQLLKPIHSHCLGLCDTQFKQAELQRAGHPGAAESPAKAPVPHSQCDEQHILPAPGEHSRTGVCGAPH